MANRELQPESDFPRDVFEVFGGIAVKLKEEMASGEFPQEAGNKILNIGRQELAKLGAPEEVLAAFDNPTKPILQS